MGKRDRHTSKSKLNLFDGVGEKPGKHATNPHVYQQCADSGKACGTEPKTMFQEIMEPYPKPIRSFGPKQAKILSQFTSSAITYAVATLVAVTYLCEWKAVLQYMPFYNGKYKKNDE